MHYEGSEEYQEFMIAAEKYFIHLYEKIIDQRRELDPGQDKSALEKTTLELSRIFTALPELKKFKDLLDYQYRGTLQELNQEKK